MRFFVLFRKLVKENNETISDVLDAIIKAKKNELLRKFISEMDDLEIRNSKLINKV